MDSPEHPTTSDPLIDPVIEAYKAGVDRSIIRHNLRLTVSERIDALYARMKRLESTREVGSDVGGGEMARTTSWIRVRIKNTVTGETMCLYHPPTAGAAGEDVDRDLRSLLGIPSPQPKGYKAQITVEALPSPADWLSSKVPATDIPPDHCT